MGSPPGLLPGSPPGVLPRASPALPALAAAPASGLPRPRARTVEPRVGLTTSGLWLGLTGVAFTLAGALGPTPGVAALGAFVLALMAVAHLSAVLARHRIAKLQVKLESAPSAVKLWEGRTSEIALSLELPATTAVYAIELEPMLSETLEGRLRPADPDATVPPATATRTHRFLLELRGLRLGDSWLQGFDLTATVALGLYVVRAFAPCLLRTTVLPRHMASGRPPLRATRAAADEQADLVHRERRGFGMEIRELRDFQAGDPFKHIAWSASARRGKLIAREFESDLQLSIWLLVDCSPSMFWGPPGQAKIDHALEIAADLARTLASGRDRVGLVLHDHESRLLIEAGHGSAHLTRLTQALLEAPHLVHEDRTELTDSELTLRVARWFEVHEGRTFYLATPIAPTAPASAPTLRKVAEGHGQPFGPSGGGHGQPFGPSGGGHGHDGHEARARAPPSPVPRAAPARPTRRRASPGARLSRAARASLHQAAPDAPIHVLRDRARPLDPSRLRPARRHRLAARPDAPPWRPIAWPRSRPASGPVGTRPRRCAHALVVERLPHRRRSRRPAPRRADRSAPSSLAGVRDADR